MPIFTSNYPHFQVGAPTLLPVPERVGALTQYTGRGVVMAFVDSGFTMHPDLDDRVLVHADAGTNHIIEEPTVSRVNDLSWHGQMTSVIAAGDGSTSNGKYRGIACESQLVLVKVSSPRGQIKEADILRGLRWLVDTHHRLNVRVVNISVGGDFVSDNPNHPIYRAVRKLVEEGVVVMVAAGNHGHDSLVPPASAPQAITVGGYDDQNSLDRAHWKPYHNNYGRAYEGTRKPEITGPAAWLASPIMPGSSMWREARWLAPLIHEENNQEALQHLLVEGYSELGLPHDDMGKSNRRLHKMIQSRINSHKLIDAQHQHVDGTSVSVAVVSSIVAQMIQANPSVSPEQVRSILQSTAQPLRGLSAEHQGAGIVDAARAVDAALKI